MNAVECNLYFQMRQIPQGKICIHYICREGHLFPLSFFSKNECVLYLLDTEEAGKSGGKLENRFACFAVWY